jgi:pyrimidine deaminase RibD-like protein
MPFNKYLIDPSGGIDVTRTLQDNIYPRKTYALCQRGTSDVLRGVPLPGKDAEHALVQVRKDFYEIPISEIASMEPVEARSEDARHMQRAIEKARSCTFEGEEETAVPRPYVGAVLVRDGVEIGAARRGEKAPGDHAEFTLLDKELRDSPDAVGGTLYTTLEPCTKRGEGKIPCVDRIVARKIRRVVVGMLDPNQSIRGEGIWVLREAGIAVDLCAIEEMTAIEDLNREFVRHFRPKRPKT